MNALQILQIAAIVVIVVLLALSIVMAEKKTSKKKEKKTITLIRCDKGDYKIEREFKPGDFVGKVEGECPKCKGVLRVYAIFVEELEPRR